MPNTLFVSLVNTSIRTQSINSEFLTVRVINLLLTSGAQRLCINLSVCPTKYFFLPYSKLFFAQMRKIQTPSQRFFFCKNLTAATPCSTFTSFLNSCCCFNLQFMEKFKEEFRKTVKLSINPKTYGNDNDLLEKVVNAYKKFNTNVKIEIGVIYQSKIEKQSFWQRVTFRYILFNSHIEKQPNRSKPPFLRIRRTFYQANFKKKVRLILRNTVKKLRLRYQIMQ